PVPPHPPLPPDPCPHAPPPPPTPPPPAPRPRGQKELAAPADAGAQAALGDAWREAAEKNSTMRPRLQSRALVWYGKAAPALSGAAKLKVETQIDALVKALGGAAEPKKGLVCWVEPGKQPADPFREHISGKQGTQDGVTVVDSGAKAFSFAGTYVTFEAPEVAKLEKRGSVFFWIKSSSYENLGYIIKREDDSGAVDLGLHIQGGGLGAWFNWPENQKGYYLRGSLMAGRWILAGVTWDERTEIHYIDGRESGVSPVAPNGLPNKRLPRLSIGQTLPEGVSDPQIGLIGSVRIYDRPLTSQEAAQLHLATRSKFR